MIYPVPSLRIAFVLKGVRKCRFEAVPREPFSIACSSKISNCHILINYYYLHIPVRRDIGVEGYSCFPGLFQWLPNRDHLVERRIDQLYWN